MFEKIKEFIKKFKTTIAVLAALIGGSTGAYLGFAPTSGYDAYLTKSLSSSATTIYVSTLKDDDGVPIQLSYDNKGYFTIDPGQDDAERIVCSGSSGNTLTNCVRGLPATGSSETGSSTLAYSHDIGSKIIMTDIAQFYNNYMNLWDNQTASGTKTFIVLPRLQSYYTPTADVEFAPKKYVDDISIAGAADATENVKGLLEFATREEMVNSTATGTTGAYLGVKAEYCATSSSATTTCVLTKSNGKIAQNFLDLTDDFNFGGNISVSGNTNLASTTITGTTTLYKTDVKTYPYASSSVATKGYVDTFAKIYFSGELVVDGSSYCPTSVSTTSIASVVGNKKSLVMLSVEDYNNSSSGAGGVYFYGAYDTYEIWYYKQKGIFYDGLVNGVKLDTDDISMVMTITDQNGNIRWKCSNSAKHVRIRVISYIQ